MHKYALNSTTRPIEQLKKKARSRELNDTLATIIRTKTPTKTNIIVQKHR